MKNRFTSLYRALFGAAVLTAASLSAQAQGVGVGTTAPDASAAFDVVSSAKGALLPRLTSAQRTAIVNPATGLIVFQTDGTPGFYYNSGTTTAPVWEQIATAAAAAVTAANGLTKTGQAIALGGALTGATAVSGITAANSFDLSGTAAPRLTNTTAASAAGNRVLTLKTPYANATPGSGGHLAFTDANDAEFGRIASRDEGGTGGFVGLAFSTSNGGVANLAERLRIAGNGRVGIGTAAPQAQLHLYNATAYVPLFQPGVAANGTGGYGELMFGNGGATKAAAIQVIDDGSFGGGLYFNVHNPTGGDNWPVGAQTAMTLRPNGNVGIGTIAPLVPLSITPGGLGAKLTLWDAASATEHYGFGISVDQLNYQVQGTASHVFSRGGKNNDGTEMMRLQGTTGNLGIGVSAPSARLDVNGSTRLRGLATAGLVTTDASGNLSSASVASFGASFIENGTALQTANFNIGGNGFLGGSVGIGTTAPIQKLEVALGGIRAGSFTPFTAVSATNQGAHLQWNRTGGDGETWLINHMGAGTTNAGIRFAGITTGTGTAPTEWGRFLNNGNFGLGTTAPATKLDVNGNFRLAVRTIPVNQATSYTLVAADVAFSVFKVTDGAYAPSINLPAASAGQVAGQELTVYSTAGNSFTINGVNTDNTAAINMPARGTDGVHAVKYLWDAAFAMWVRIQ